MTDRSYNVELRLTANGNGLTATVGKVRADFGKMGAAGQKSFNQAEGAANRFNASGRRVEDTLGRVKRLAVGLGLGVGFIEGAKGLGRLADQATNVNARFKLMAGNVSDVNRAYQATFDIAQRTGVEFEGQIKLTGRIAEALRDQGMTADAAMQQSLITAETIAQAVIVSGEAAESSKAAITQLIQGLQSGQLRGQELRSVLEQTPAVARALADGLGVAIGELYELGEAGAITVPKIVNALNKMREKVQADFEAMPLTIARAWQAVENATLQYVGTADKASGASRQVAEAIQYAAENFEIIANSAVTTGTIIATVYAGKLIKSAAAYTQTTIAQAAAAKAAAAAEMEKMKATQAVAVGEQRRAAAVAAYAVQRAQATAAEYAAARANLANAKSVDAIAAAEIRLGMTMRANTAAETAARASRLSLAQANTALAASTVATGAASATSVGQVLSFGKSLLTINNLMAGLVGWEIGTYLYNEFQTVRIAGAYLAGGLMKAFEAIKGAGQYAWVTIKHAGLSLFEILGKAGASYLEASVWMWEKIGDVANAAMASIASQFDVLSNIPGLEKLFGGLRNGMETLRAKSKATFDAVAGGVTAVATSIRSATAKTTSYADEINEVTSSISAGYANATAATNDMVDAAYLSVDANEKATKATKALDIGLKSNTAETKANTEAKKQHEKATKAVRDVYKEALDSIREETSLLALNREELERYDFLKRTINDALDEGNALSNAQVETLNAEYAAYQANAAAAEYARGAADDYKRTWVGAIDGVAGAFGDWMARGFKDWKDFSKGILGIAKQTISQMAALWARNGIMRLFGLGGGGAGLPGAAMAGGGNPLASLVQGASGGAGGNGGILGQLLGGGSSGGGFSLFNPSSWSQAGSNFLDGFMGAAGGSGSPALGLTGTVLAGLAGAIHGYRGTNGGIAGIGAGLSYGAAGIGLAGTAAGLLGGAGLGGAMGGAFGALGAGAAIPVVGWALAAMAGINALTGGGLFGTKYKPENMTNTISLGADGGTATTRINEVRRRSLFRGRQWRDRTIETSDEMRQAADQMYKAVMGAMTQAAEALGTDVPDMIQASLRSWQDIDKKTGKPKGDPKFFVDYLGRTWEEATQEAAQKRIGAEALIAVVEAALEGTSALAEPYRDNAENLQGFADMAAAAVADIKKGFTLMGDGTSIKPVLALVEDMAKANEALAQTYARLAVSAKAMDTIYERAGVIYDGNREAFVRLGVAVTDAAGGADKANALFANIFETFYKADQSLDNFDERYAAMLKPATDVGLSGQTTSAQFRAGFNAVLAEGNAEAIAQWLQAGAAIRAAREAMAQLTNSLQQAQYQLRQFEADTRDWVAALDQRIRDVGGAGRDIAAMYEASLPGMREVYNTATTIDSRMQALDQLTQGVDKWLAAARAQIDAALNEARASAQATLNDITTRRGAIEAQIRAAESAGRAGGGYSSSYQRQSTRNNAAQISALKAKHKTAMDALEAAQKAELKLIEEQHVVAMDAVKAQIDALKEQIKLAEAFRRISEDAARVHDKMQVSTANPASAAMRFGILESQVNAARSAFNTSSGAAKAKAAGELLQLLQERQQMAQDLYQRPSDEALAQYNRTVKEIADLRDATANLAEAKPVEDRLLAAQQQAVTLAEQHAAKLDAIRASHQLSRDAMRAAHQAELDAIRGAGQNISSSINSGFNHSSSYTGASISTLREQLAALAEEEKAAREALSAAEAEAATARAAINARALEYYEWIQKEGEKLRQERHIQMLDHLAAIERAVRNAPVSVGNGDVVGGEMGNFNPTTPQPIKQPPRVVNPPVAPVIPVAPPRDPITPTHPNGGDTHLHITVPVTATVTEPVDNKQLAQFVGDQISEKLTGVNIRKALKES